MQVIRILALLAACAAPMVVLTGQERPRSLDESAIADAITWAREGDPAPYPLHFSGPTFVAGYVYTPFVRVALAARRVFREGQTFEASQLPADVVAPNVYFALRWYCAGDECRDPAFHARRGEAPRVVMVPSGHLPWSTAAIEPLWTSADTSILARFGASVPTDDIAVIAAFAIDRVKPGFDVFAYRLNERGTKGGQLRGGRLLARDLAHWR